MGKEIERKYLVSNSSYRNFSKGILYKQGYLSSDPSRIVRVRCYDGKGYITVKGLSKGAIRSEYEYEIPIEDSMEMIDTLCDKSIIVKLRYRFEYLGHTWEIDEFLGDNNGLVLAEIELDSEDEDFSKPIWIGMEVTEDFRYSGSNLAINPYCNWK